MRIGDYRNIVILTGAGISAESGLKTFRDSNGLWEGHDVYEVATPEGFQANPQLVLDFYNMRRKQLKEAQPNGAHRALAKLEQRCDGNFMLITQNVDDLHERGGSRNIRHMHGSLLQSRCLETDAIFPCDDDILLTDNRRPHIVWFGEMPLYMEEIYQALHAADLFISIGTSGAVYPAAGFIQEIKHIGMAHTVELNLEPSEGSMFFDETRYGKASEVVPAFVKALLGEQQATA